MAMSGMKLFSLKKEESEFEAVEIKRSIDAYNIIKKFYNDDLFIYESCFILLLNRANKTIGYAKISQGGIVGVIIDPRIVMKYAVESLATGFIIAHNHPSGYLKPSKEDILITNRLKQCGQIMEVQLLDHLIIGDNEYLSMQDEGLF